MDGIADVYLLRGLWDVFSLGLDDLALRLCDEGVDAVALSGPSWPVLSEVIAQSPQRAASSRRVVLVGHSSGADEAVLLARDLGARGIRVELLVLLDATRPLPIPDTVERCVHLYIPTPLAERAPDVFPGNPVEAADGNLTTTIVNRVVTPEEFPGVDHFNIESAELIHAVVLEEIARVTGADGDGE
jgi:hypothetical protein